jgi:hypothetical protein
MDTVTLLAVRPSHSEATQLWAAAVPQDQAVQAVLKKVPQGWTAEIADHQLDAHQIATLNLKPGEVTEYSSGLVGRRK